MHLHHLCFVLPSDGDDIHPFHHHQTSKPPRSPPPPPPALQSKPRSIGTHLRNTLHKFLNSKRDIKFCGFCSKPPSAIFHDTDGVQFSKEISVGAHSPKTFTYSELYIATKGFSQDQILGSGGFGRVYRAVLPSDGTVAAVKCLSETGDRFEKSFAAELVAVAHLRHRNLVPLRGWCVNNDQLLLVYDYMPNRSLDRLLFRRVGNKGTVAGLTSPPLNWEKRMRIVKGLAAALFYLHEQLEAQIIHRDVKTSNVMLDSNFNARLGDFGLARWMEHELGYATRTPSMSDNSLRLADTTSIGGTIGYLPPESFQRKTAATAKSDVFSFGIVLLEICSGRRAVDLTLPDDEIILVDRVRRLADENMVLQAADTRLPDGTYNLHEMKQLIHLGLLCTLHDPQTRPSMRWIVEVLSGGVSSTLPDLPTFKSHPPYISVCRNRNTSSTGTTAATTTTITITTSFGVASGSSISTAFVTANEESLYITAQEHGDNGGGHATGQRSRRQLNPFLMVEPPREITYKEIVSATDNFSDANRLSEVDFGTAYYGVLDNHDIVVKRLGMKTCPALRLRFANELANLGRLRHRNLVQLRGWCTEHGEMLVVYDYSANRLLGQLLSHHNRRESTFLRWNDRYNIVKSLACAIRYLHEEWEEQVIHRNITSSAIYIDHDMNPRLGSFALAEFLTRNEHGHHVVIDKKVCVRGIFGYMAPEYMELGEATPMADVYSFGVVVLEVVTGRMAVDFRRPEVLLVKKVHGLDSWKGNYEEIVDPRLDGEYNRKELGRLVKLAMACTQSNPDLRPKMTTVVSILDGNDRWLSDEGLKQGMDEWKERNLLSLSLIRRIQALGIQ